MPRCTQHNQLPCIQIPMQLSIGTGAETFNIDMPAITIIVPNGSYNNQDSWHYTGGSYSQAERACACAASCPPSSHAVLRGKVWILAIAVLVNLVRNWTKICRRKNYVYNDFIHLQCVSTKAGNNIPLRPMNYSPFTFRSRGHSLS